MKKNSLKKSGKKPQARGGRTVIAPSPTAKYKNRLRKRPHSANPYESVPAFTRTYDGPMPEGYNDFIPKDKPVTMCSGPCLNCMAQLPSHERGPAAQAHSGHWIPVGGASGTPVKATEPWFFRACGWILPAALGAALFGLAMAIGGLL